MIIYKLFHKTKELCYIGSTRCLKKRIYNHKTQAKYNTHIPLYNSIRNNGGFEEWSVQVLRKFDYINKEELRKYEEEFIQLYKSTLNIRRAYTSDIIKKQQNKLRLLKFRNKNPDYMKIYMKGYNAKKKKIRAQ